MIQDLSIPAGRDDIDSAIQLAYTRADENFRRAIDLAQSVPWLWGENASFNDYQNTDVLDHQLTGELPLSRRGYRTDEYGRCNDSVAKELSATFSQDIPLINKTSVAHTPHLC